MRRYRITLDPKLDAVVRQRAGQRRVTVNAYLGVLVERGLLQESAGTSGLTTVDRLAMYETRNLIKQLVESRDPAAARAARAAAELEVKQEC
jgi:hypothetical protein